MPISRKKITQQTEIEEIFDVSSETTDISCGTNATTLDNNTGITRKIETGAALLSVDDRVKETNKTNKHNDVVGRTVPDLITLFFKDVESIFVALIYVIAFLILPKHFNRSGILYPLIVGTLLVVIWYIFRFIKWLIDAGRKAFLKKKHCRK